MSQACCSKVCRACLDIPGACTAKGCCALVQTRTLLIKVSFVLFSRTSV